MADGLRGPFEGCTTPPAPRRMRSANRSPPASGFARQLSHRDSGGTTSAGRGQEGMGAEPCHLSLHSACHSAILPSCPSAILATMEGWYLHGPLCDGICDDVEQQRRGLPSVDTCGIEDCCDCHHTVGECAEMVEASVGQRACRLGSAHDPPHAQPPEFRWHPREDLGPLGSASWPGLHVQ